MNAERHRDRVEGVNERAIRYHTVFVGFSTSPGRTLLWSRWVQEALTPKEAAEQVLTKHRGDVQVIEVEVIDQTAQTRRFSVKETPRWSLVAEVPR